MAPNDPDIDKLNQLISESLARIDEDAFRLQENGEDVDFDMAERLEQATSDLHELIDSLVVVDAETDYANVNPILDQVANQCLGELDMPVVLRQSLSDEPAEVAVPAQMVSAACHRVMVLVAGCLDAGSELSLSTRVEADKVLVEVECRGGHRQQIERIAQLGETLHDFVAEFGGSFEARGRDHDVFAVVELPRVMASERIESDGMP